MAVDKAKRVGKKGQKKKVVDPFSKKDWYDVKAPSYFEKRNVGKTLVTRTQGNKMAADGLKGRVFEMSLADMQGNEELAYRKVRLIVEDVSGKNVLLNFHGMDFSSDKLKGMVRKWQSLIEAMVEVKTTDNYVLRIFTIAFTKKHKTQIKKTCYAQSSQIRQIRQKIFEIVQNAANGCDLKEFVKKLIAESIGKEIEKSCQSIYPLQNVYVRKVKIMRKPKLDLSKLMELHGDVSSSSEGKVNREGKEFSEPAVLETV